MSNPNYDTTKRKLEVIWEQNELNKNDTVNLPDKTINFTDEHFQKTLSIIPLLEGVSGNRFTRFRGKLILKNCPEWVIPMIRPLLFYSVAGDGFNALNIDFSGGADIFLDYWLNKIGVDTYNFQYQTQCDASFESDLLVNLYLYIINNRDYSTFIKAKE